MEFKKTIGVADLTLSSPVPLNRGKRESFKNVKAKVVERRRRENIF